MNKNSWTTLFCNKLMLPIAGRLKFVCEYLKFKILHPSVPIIKPSLVGSYYSQDGQDLYLSNLLLHIIEKNFDDLWIVDVGCNHPSKFSNSLFFEKFFYIKVLAIDAIQEFENIWRIERPNAKFVVSAVGETSGTIKLNIPLDNENNNMFSFVDSAYNKRPDLLFEKRTISLATLESLMLDREIRHVLFISIDIEGFELNALKGINFALCKIYCIILENNSNSLLGAEDIREYLKQKGFFFATRIGTLDDVYLNNNYFANSNSIRRPHRL